MWERLAQQADALPGVEVTAVLCAVIYLLLAIRQNILCWLFAAVSAALFVWVFFVARLYMEAALNVLYFVLAIYGWISWSGRDQSASLPVTRLALQRHAAALVVIAVLVVASGAVLSHYTDAALPYLDSATTWLSVWATVLVAWKVLENWWYWLLIDVVSIGLFWSRDLELSAVLFGIYVVMIPFGYLSWKRSMMESADA